MRQVILSLMMLRCVFPLITTAPRLHHHRHASSVRRCVFTLITTAPRLHHHRHASSVRLFSVISYFTDVEGDIDYFNRFITHSKVLYRDKSQTVHLKQNTHLVFGGDATDRGGYDLACLDLLLDLKSRYMDQVHFVYGNRDINKLRISQELGQPIDGLKTPVHEGVFWVPHSSSSTPPTDSTERLRWMLNNTMGSPDAFRGRARELLERGEPCDDLAVTNSFRNSSSPDGELGRYLKQAQIAVKIGPVLFIHAALPKPPEVHPEVAGQNALPFSDANSNSNSVENWIFQLNEFASTQIKNWSENIHNTHNTQNKIWSTTGGFPHDRIGGDLIQYGMVSERSERVL